MRFRGIVILLAASLALAGCLSSSNPSTTASLSEARSIADSTPTAHTLISFTAYLESQKSCTFPSSPEARREITDLQRAWQRIANPTATILNYTLAGLNDSDYSTSVKALSEHLAQQNAGCHATVEVQSREITGGYAFDYLLHSQGCQPVKDTLPNSTALLTIVVGSTSRSASVTWQASPPTGRPSNFEQLEPIYRLVAGLPCPALAAAAPIAYAAKIQSQNASG